MREVVVDTETTGLNPDGGDRVCEIGCVELFNHVPTGVVFQRYVNPECPMPEEARRVHGLDDGFLADKPTFAEIVDDLVAFLGDAPLVMHNAEFDVRFLNVELVRCGRPPVALVRAIDTVAIAKRRFPGAGASLDALCRRFQIDLSGRALHGALLDARLLASVYLELVGGREPALDLRAATAPGRATPVERKHYPARPHAPTEEEMAAHLAFLAKISNPLWLA